MWLKQPYADTRGYRDNGGSGITSLVIGEGQTTNLRRRRSFSEEQLSPSIFTQLPDFHPLKMADAFCRFFVLKSLRRFFFWSL